LFPLKDNIPVRRIPATNLGLILVNVLCFAYEFSLSVGLDAFIQAHGFIPARFMAAQAENMFDPSRFGPVFSSMFLHGGVLHLVANMWMLWIFGDTIEDSMGHGRYLVFYLVCGAISVLAQALANPASPVPLLGASGAIAGVLGAYFLLHPQARILTLVPIVIFFYVIELPAFIFLGFWVLLQILQGYAYLAMPNGAAVGGVAWWAHIGGFGAGMLLINLFKEKPKVRGYKRRLRI
jgi:membrane associated rhomboid family serine protease